MPGSADVKRHELRRNSRYSTLQPWVGIFRIWPGRDWRRWRGRGALGSNGIDRRNLYRQRYRAASVSRRQAVVGREALAFYVANVVLRGLAFSRRCDRFASLIRWARNSAHWVGSCDCQSQKTTLSVVADESQQRHLSIEVQRPRMAHVAGGRLYCSCRVVPVAEGNCPMTCNKPRVKDAV